MLNDSYSIRLRCLVKARRHIPCNKQRLNPLPSKQIKTSLVPEREVLIAEKEIEIKVKQKSIQEDWGLSMMRMMIDQQENE